MKRTETILVVEDDASLRLSLQLTLRTQGYRVKVAKNGEDGLNEALAGDVDLVLLDVMMPALNGFEVCEEIRSRNPTLPIVMVTAKGELEDRVRGLRLGADDYLVKPFGVDELSARVDAALRRTRLVRQESEVVRIGRVVVDFGAHTITCDGKTLESTALEIKVLRFLLDHEGKTVSREKMVDHVWGADYFGTARTVDNFMSRLRSKIEEDPKEPRHIVTVRGAGYRFSR